MSFDGEKSGLNIHEQISIVEEAACSCRKMLIEDDR